MSTRTQNGPHTARRSFIIALVFVALAVAFFYRAKPGPTPENLVPLGTNILQKGMPLFDPHSREVRGEVIEASRAYEFDDGSIRPGVLLVAPNGAEVWVPRENVNDALVPQ